MEKKIIEKLDELNQTPQEENIIRLKQERGLIEYANSTKKIITEDNRQVLND